MSYQNAHKYALILSIAASRNVSRKLSAKECDRLSEDISTMAAEIDLRIAYGLKLQEQLRKANRNIRKLRAKVRELKCA